MIVVLKPEDAGEVERVGFRPRLVRIGDLRETDEVMSDSLRLGRLTLRSRAAGFDRRASMVP